MKHRRRLRDLDPELVEIGWKAQVRLCNRYRRLRGRGKDGRKVVTALGRELLGYMWDIGVRIEKQFKEKAPGTRRVPAA